MIGRYATLAPNREDEIRRLVGLDRQPEIGGVGRIARAYERGNTGRRP